MPIPKPIKNEKEKDFINRFMNNYTIIQDYPDKNQRLAIAYQQWKSIKKSCICDLIKSIDLLVKADNEELKKDLNKYIELDYTIERINSLEMLTYGLLKEQIEYYIKRIEKHVTKASISDILNYVKGSLLAADDFIKKFGNEFKRFLSYTTEKLTESYIKNIDKDLFFSFFSDRTTDWISEWSEELAKLIHEESVDVLERILKKGLEEGKGINKIANSLRDSFGFSRTRARRIAITEVLTAHSHASFESAIQNPSIDRVMWRHSGTRGIKPRANHVALDSKIINKGELFDLGSEKAQYPRDTKLSAKERVNCHCLLQQIVNDDILGLSLDERIKLQEEAIKNDNRIYNRKARPKNNITTNPKSNNIVESPNRRFAEVKPKNNPYVKIPSKPSISKPKTQETSKPDKKYTRKYLENLSMNKLKEIAREKAIPFYYKNNLGGENKEKAIDSLLSQPRSKTSLIKDILSMQKGLLKKG